MVFTPTYLFQSPLVDLLACKPKASDGQLGQTSEPPTLSSWNDAEVRPKRLDFVAAVSDPSSPDFVPESECTTSFDNSDGDLQVLQYATGGEGPRTMVLVHHDDSEREYADDRDSMISRPDKIRDEARTRNCILISMSRDWRIVFPFEDMP